MELEAGGDGDCDGGCDGDDNKNSINDNNNIENNDNKNNDFNSGDNDNNNKKQYLNFFWMCYDVCECRSLMFGHEALIQTKLIKIQFDANFIFLSFFHKFT